MDGNPMRFGHRIILMVALAAGGVGLGLPVSHGADLDCVIEPNMVVSINSPVEGLLETVSAGRGDRVRKGQILATLESSVERASVAITEARTRMEGAIRMNQARLEMSARRLRRSQKLFRRDVITPREMDEVKDTKRLAELGLFEAMENKRLAELELVHARAALAMRIIRSPITGVVVDRYLSPGEYAREKPLMKLAQIDPLRVEVFTPISMLGRIKIGMKARVKPEGPFTGTYEARVKVVDHVADAASGTFGVRLELPNPGYRLPAGLKCKVDLGVP